jgi:cation transporter-like permease
VRASILTSVRRGGEVRGGCGIVIEGWKPVWSSNASLPAASPASMRGMPAWCGIPSIQESAAVSLGIGTRDRMAKENLPIILIMYCIFTP